MEKKPRIPKGVTYTQYEHEGKIITIKNDNRTWSVYVLYLNGDPVYVGCSTNIKSRIHHHRASKRKFDSYRIAIKLYYEVHASVAEHTLISYLKATYPGLENKKNTKESSGIFKLSGTNG